ncbi:Dual specificity protein phosphatase 1 [Taenia crassiceps]|uniref:protein-tyrosine-phosphatase n=1 Tax=Taenia crassiceps TaxID=6207 RepID=A0ABR4QL28_9CEST
MDSIKIINLEDPDFFLRNSSLKFMDYFRSIELSNLCQNIAGRRRKIANLKRFLLVFRQNPQILLTPRLKFSRWLTVIGNNKGRQCCANFQDEPWSLIEVELLPDIAKVTDNEVLSTKAVKSKTATKQKRSLRERCCEKIQRLNPILKLPESKCIFYRPFPVDPPVSEILDFLYLGNERDSGDAQMMEERSITHIINATREQSNFFEGGGKVEYLRVPVDDNDKADLMPYFRPVIEFIDEAMRAGGRVLVHCKAGVSRSPSLVIAYLVAHSSLTVMEAFTLVNHLRSAVGPSLHFLGQVEQFCDSIRPEFKCSSATIPATYEDRYVGDMISRRWQDFQLCAPPAPAPLVLL